MYNPLLDTFIVVSEAKSFNKASKELFISVPAVKNQIDALEAHLGFTLFDRTNNGLILTDKGKLFLEEAKKLISLSNSVLSKIKEDDEEEDVIKLGISMLNDAHDFRKIWSIVNEKLDFKLRFIQLSDEKEEIPKQINRLGKTIDLTYGVYDPRVIGDKFSFLKTGVCRPALMVPINHRLSKKKIIKIDDLKNETIYIEKNSSIFDSLLCDNKLNIKIIYANDFYTISTLSIPLETGGLVVIPDTFANIDPEIKYVPLDFGRIVDAGLIYEKHPSSKVLKVINATKKYLKTHGK